MPIAVLSASGTDAGRPFALETQSCHRRRLPRLFGVSTKLPACTTMRLPIRPAHGLAARWAKRVGAKRGGTPIRSNGCDTVHGYRAGPVPGLATAGCACDIAAAAVALWTLPIVALNGFIVLRWSWVARKAVETERQPSTIPVAHVGRDVPSGVCDVASTFGVAYRQMHSVMFAFSVASMTRDCAGSNVGRWADAGS